MQLTSINFGYDANGNRNTQTVTPAIAQAATTSYTIDTASNRLTLINSASSVVTLAFDANGSATQDASGSYSYDAAGRLVGLTSSYSMSAPASYAYDGLRQRVQKSVGSTTTLYAYDEARHLIGEYDGTGLSINETVWLGSLPVAALQASGTYYIHTDHLNAPWQIDDVAKQVVWTWDTTAFGTNLPNQDPNSTGHQFVYNLRFPGQYYDAESGIFYNLNRDYDPATGRYIESDPLGLAGDSFSTYAYVGGNPMSFVDPTGLFHVVTPNICAGQPTFAAASACLQGPANQRLQQRTQDLQALGDQLQSAIGKSKDCDCKKKLQQLYDNWTVRPTIQDAPGNYNALTSLDMTNRIVTGGDTTFYNGAWGSSNQSLGLLNAFLHEYGHMTPDVSSIPGLGLYDQNEIAAQKEQKFLVQAVLNGSSLCP